MRLATASALNTGSSLKKTLGISMPRLCGLPQGQGQERGGLYSRAMTRTNADLGRLLLRITLGICLLLHGIAKLQGGIDGIVQAVTGAGLPGFVAYGVYIGEIVAPLLLILGFYSRVGALLVAINMVFAIALVHRADVFKLAEQGGWALELQGMYLIAAIALALMGPGRFGINDR